MSAVGATSPVASSASGAAQNGGNSARCKIPLLPMAAMAVIVCLTALRPGDAPWLNDEPILIHRALVADRTPSTWLGVRVPFTLVNHGLLHSQGQDFGPASVWFYQVLLALTHDPVTLVAIRAVVVGAITAWSLLWLAEALGMSPWLAVATMLSPWLWFYSRQLWDNTLCIPLSALAMAAYAADARRPRGWTLALCVASVLAMLLIHLMSLAIAAALATAIACRLRRRPWRQIVCLAAILAAWIAVSLPYWLRFLGEMQGSSPVVEASPERGFFFWLWGPLYLSGMQMDLLLGSGWEQWLGSGAGLVRAGEAISALAFVACWIGMVLAVRRLVRRRRQRQPWGALEQTLAVALAAVAAQMLLDGFLRVYGLPHYFSATWICYAIFAWLAADALARQRPMGGRLMQALLSLWAMSMIAVVVGVVLVIARNGGTRTREYGTTLRSQMAAARIIQSCAPASEIEMRYSQWQVFPLELVALRELIPARGFANVHLVVRYEDAFPGDARVAVDLLPPGRWTRP